MQIRSAVSCDAICSCAAGSHLSSSSPSIRLTPERVRALHGERLYVAKVGDIKVGWSRPLPSVPSSVTVIREPDGRY